jgi:fluoride exporter
MMNFILVGLAGFIGAVSRYSLYLFEQSLRLQNFPYATLFINLSGCLLAGILFGVATRVAPDYKHYVTLTLIGFVGSYTTFSTFSAETLHLIETNNFFKVSLNIAANVMGGILMVWLGRAGTQLNLQ